MDSHQNNNNNNNNILMDFLCKTFFSLSFFVYVELFWFPTKKKKKEKKVHLCLARYVHFTSDWFPN